MRKRVRSFVAGLLVLVNASAGCTSWQVETVAPKDLLDREDPKAIQIRDRLGGKLVLSRPRLAGDTLAGQVRGEERRIPLADVDRLAVRRVNGLRTLGLILAAPVVILMGAVGIGCAVGADCTVAP